MTLWTVVEAAQAVVSLIGLGLGWRLMRDARREWRQAEAASPAEREVLRERWHTAHALGTLAFVMFASNAVEMAGVESLPVLVAANGLGTRVVVVAWAWMRLSSRRRLWALVEPRP